MLESPGRGWWCWRPAAPGICQSSPCYLWLTGCTERDPGSVSTDAGAGGGFHNSVLAPPNAKPGRAGSGFLPSAVIAGAVQPYD